MENNEPRLAKLRTASQMLDISESAVRRLIRDGELRAVRIVADLRIPISEIDDLIARKLAGAEDQALDTSNPEATA